MPVMDWKAGESHHKTKQSGLPADTVGHSYDIYRWDSQFIPAVMVQGGTSKGRETWKGWEVQGKKGEKNGNRKEGKEVRKKRGEAGGEKRGMSRDNRYGSLNENSFPGTLVFKHLISSEWFCLERLWNLQETKPCWRKNIPGGSASRVYRLNSPPILSFYFLFMGVVKPAAWSCHQVTFPSGGELNPSVTIN